MTACKSRSRADVSDKSATSLVAVQKNTCARIADVGDGGRLLKHCIQSVQPASVLRDEAAGLLDAATLHVEAHFQVSR
eukprot:CAMPEP_0203940014 /NCGR_PEP_ID=MMETSP0359-20131031/76709_1 /ASSEMBLY_ACC=CAM_ASM_000338 /TAXON_ID=268821 /ORGANISM="Scrippsiella Hangoei, Strain SHTV-5" /LENGTH=77 /DNA_ID=CAMNT_0050870405 /DNA_START=321 /DNA_END=555 /DNA_ORIENTATION=+